MSEKSKTARSDDFQANHDLRSRSDPRAELSLLTSALRHQLKRGHRRGRMRVQPPRESALPTAPKSTPSAPVAAGQTPLTSEAADTPRASEAMELRGLDWAELRQKVATCQACELSKTRLNTVFADGQAPARILFVGEAPGQHEDEQGVPFVGRSGALLTDIIQKGMGLNRSEVAIANVIKCRPPANRDPSPAEKSQCAPYLMRQIELIDPELIIALGRHAAGYLLRTDSSLGSLRGRIHRPNHLGGRRVLATYHPSYLLRCPEMKNAAWQDILLGMDSLGLSRPN